MNVRRIIFATAVLLTIGMSTSCAKDNLADEDALYNETGEKSINGREIQEQDT